MSTTSKHECPCTKFKLNKRKTKTVYPKGTVIFMEGSPIFGLYCLCNGKVKLSRSEEDGKEIILQLLSQGEIIGYRCFFNRTNFSMSATALEDSEISFLDKSFIHQSIKTNSSISNYFIQSLSQELSAADRRTSTLIRNKVGERMAEFFLNTLKNFGKTEQGYDKLDIHLSREEMASIIGASAETITRFISDFKDNGIIMEKKGSIYILDSTKLHTLCKLPSESFR